MRFDSLKNKDNKQDKSKFDKSKFIKSKLNKFKKINYEFIKFKLDKFKIIKSKLTMFKFIKFKSINSKSCNIFKFLFKNFSTSKNKNKNKTKNNKNNLNSINPNKYEGDLSKVNNIKKININDNGHINDYCSNNDNDYKSNEDNKYKSDRDNNYKSNSDNDYNFINDNNYKKYNSEESSAIAIKNVHNIKKNFLSDRKKEFQDKNNKIDTKNKFKISKENYSNDMSKNLELKNNKIRKIKFLFNKITNFSNFNINNSPNDDIQNINNDMENLENNESKIVMGAAVFGLIILIILFSSYYFLFYQPYQNDLATAKNDKLNELNSLFKGPLTLDNNVISLNSEIELSKSPEEVKAIDVIRPATSSWREYHNNQINKTQDDFGRVMLNYEDFGNEISMSMSEKSEGGNNIKSKNIIMNSSDAHSFVIENDANILSNIFFKKPDTVVVPILINRLQAGAGLISVGSIVDIYTLSNSSYQTQLESSNSIENDNNSINNSSNNNDYSSNNANNSQDSNNIDLNNNMDSNINDNSNLNINNLNSYIGGSIGSPDISGSTVLAIMRSKDSGVIDANYIKSRSNINGNYTNQFENSSSFFTDIEEIIRASIAGGYNEEYFLPILERYGLKLSDYERESSLGEIDVQYLLLIEIPREDVSHVINNMDNIILTIPTSNAPNWMLYELKKTYLGN